MSVKSHLEALEEQAALFALGALPRDEAGKFQMRLSAACPLCHEALHDVQSTLTALSMTVPDVSPPASLRARLLERLSPAKPRRHTIIGELVRAGDTAWESTEDPGIEIRQLHGRETMLIRMAPGSWLPSHRHDTAEQCLVLEGSITGGGVTANAGDYVFMPHGSSHPSLFSQNGCVMLIAYT
jgi:hypothetical protein